MIHIDSFGCLIPGCQNIVGTSEIENKSEELIFALYPNPFSGYLGMLSIVDYPEELSLSIYDLKGEILLHEKIQPYRGYQYVLDTSHLIPGWYILRISDKQGVTRQLSKLSKI